MNFIDKTLLNKKNDILLENQLLKNQISYAVMFIKESLNKVTHANKDKSAKNSKNKRYNNINNYNSDNSNTETGFNNNILTTEDRINYLDQAPSDISYKVETKEKENTRKDYQNYISKEKDVAIDLNEVKSIKTLIDKNKYEGITKSPSNNNDARVINNIQIINKINNNYNSSTKNSFVNINRKINTNNNNNTNTSNNNINNRNEVSKEIIRNKNEIEKIRVKLNSFVKYNHLNKIENEIKDKKRKLNVLLDENLYIESIINQLKYDFNIENNERELSKAQEQVDLLRRKNNSLKKEIRNTDQTLLKYNLEIVHLENKEKELNEKEKNTQSRLKQNDIKAKHEFLKKELANEQVLLDSEKQIKNKKLEKLRLQESKLISEVDSYNKIVSNQEREIVLWEKAIKNYLIPKNKNYKDGNDNACYLDQSYKITYLEPVIIKKSQISTNLTLKESCLLNSTEKIGKGDGGAGYGSNLDDYDINEDLDGLILPTSNEEDPDIKNLFLKFNNDKSNNNNNKNAEKLNNLPSKILTPQKVNQEIKSNFVESKNDEMKENNNFYTEKIEKINNLSKFI
jgi:hypothetical protein